MRSLGTLALVGVWILAVVYCAMAWMWMARLMIGQ